MPDTTPPLIWIEGERIPALRAPGLGDVTTLEHDVFDAGIDEPLAHRESCVAGADNDRVDHAHMMTW